MQINFARFQPTTTITVSTLNTAALLRIGRKFSLATNLTLRIHARGAESIFFTFLHKISYITQMNNSLTFFPHISRTFPANSRRLNK